MADKIGACPDFPPLDCSRGDCLTQAHIIAQHADLTSEKSRHHAAYFLYRKVRPGTALWTDGAAIYKGIGKWWPVDHTRDLHAKFEFEHTSEIEGMFGNLRTFIRRMYHHVSGDKLPEYVREFSFRFSSPELFENPHNYLTKTLTLATTH